MYIDNGGITVNSEERLVELFLQKYNICFDENKEVKACGRNSCTELIVICEDLGRKMGKVRDYGNVSTGVMNVDNIRKLYNEVA